MPFDRKDWHNLPQTDTPISAAGLIDLETRLSAYADLAAETIPIGPQGPAGATGEQGSPGPGGNWRGGWLVGTTYALADATARSGLAYISNVNGNVGHDPATDDGTNWTRISPGQQGVQIIKNAPHQPYGAKGDGASDDSAIFQQFFDDLKAAGGGEGIIPIPPGGIYNLANPITVTLLKSTRLRAAAGGSQADNKPILRYTGLGATSAITFVSPAGVRLEGLDFQWSNAGFTGKMVDFVGGSGDCFQNTIEHCAFVPNGHLANGQGLGITEFLKGSIRRCDFAWGSRAIVIGDSHTGTHSQYVNGTSIRDCGFASSVLNPIYLMGADIESCLFDTLTFEPLASNVCGGFEGNTSLIYENLWINMFMAEGAANGGIFMKNMWNAGRPCTIIGGEIGGPAGNGFGNDGSVALDLRGNWTIIGTKFNGGANAYVFSNPGANQFALVWIGGALGGGLTSAHTFAGTLPSPFSAIGVAAYPETRPAVAQVVSRGALNGFSPNNILANMMGQFVEVTRGASATVTIQPQSAAAFPIGGYVDLWNSNSLTAGAAILAAGIGVTLMPATPHITAGGVARITQVASNVWAVTGDVS